MVFKQNRNKKRAVLKIFQELGAHIVNSHTDVSDFRALFDRSRHMQEDLDDRQLEMTLLKESTEQERRSYSRARAELERKTLALADTLDALRPGLEEYSRAIDEYTKRKAQILSEIAFINRAREIEERKREILKARDKRGLARRRTEESLKAMSIKLLHHQRNLKEVQALLEKDEACNNSLREDLDMGQNKIEALDTHLAKLTRDHQETLKDLSAQCASKEREWKEAETRLNEIYLAIGERAYQLGHEPGLYSRWYRALDEELK